MDTVNWIITWFSNQTGISGTDLTSKVNENYFENNLIDSFTFITLISDLEDEYNISFSNDEFLDRSFSTISGLVRIIEAKITNNE